ncbi:MAG TPA: GNAT family N-acetyltransferase, partial [Limnochordia bacterium]|nr:GNAT family N-acetyltransferase [Limnochordia bacterium]
MSTPDRQLKTLYVVDSRGRIVSTREPGAQPGPAFALVRGASACAWAVRVDVPETIGAELRRLAAEEPPTTDWRAPLNHFERVAALAGGRVWSGPAFLFPDDASTPARGEFKEALRPVWDAGLGGAVRLVEDFRHLARFNGWTAEELPDRAPIVAVMVDGYAVSVCFCARRSDVAAEAGLETLEAFRGRGYGTLVTAAWAQAVRASGRTPLYSTSWDNAASLA